MGTTNRIPDKCNHTQTCIQSRILFFFPFPSEKWIKRKYMYGFLQSLYSLDQPSNNKKTLSSVFIYFSKVSRSLSRIPFVSHLPCISCYYCSCENPSEWRDQESHFSTRLSRTPSLWLVSGKLFSYFVWVARGSFLLFGPDIYDGPVFICSRQRIVWTNIGRDHIHNLMPTWAAAPRSVSVALSAARHKNKKKKEKPRLSFLSFFWTRLYPSLSLPFPIITSNWHWCNQISRWFPITSLVVFFSLSSAENERSERAHFGFFLISLSTDM